MEGLVWGQARGWKLAVNQAQIGQRKVGRKLEKSKEVKTMPDNLEVKMEA